MLTKIGCVSGCSVVICSSSQNKTTKRKGTYLLRCSHGLLVEENGSIEYDGDDIDPSNAIKEQLKRVKQVVIKIKVRKELFVPPVSFIEIECIQFVHYRS
jgi:hypothetical protein